MTVTFLTGVLFSLCFSLIWAPIYLAIMTYVTPKPLMERYFKKPHFNSGELIVYRSFPSSLMRGLVFTAACVMPRYWEGRQMPDYLDHVPNWYLRASKIFIYTLFVQLTLVLLLFAGLLIHLEIIES